MLAVNLPINVETKLIEYSQKRHIEVEKVIVKAVVDYLKYEDEFMKDLEIWDKLSDEALITFEKECL
jgi:hypothetical protein